MSSPLPKIEFMPRLDFTALSMHQKNDYLQNLAERFAQSTDRPFLPLDKDALARLRRFYARRSLADLRLDALPNTPLNQALRGLGDPWGLVWNGFVGVAGGPSEVTGRPGWRRPRCRCRSRR